MREQFYLKTARVSPLSLFFDYYLFFDTNQYLADQLFIRHKVRVWFDREYVKDGSPYCAIFCHVRKKDVLRFLNALAELKNKMILCGHPDYESETGKYLDDIERASEIKDIWHWIRKKPADRS